MTADARSEAREAVRRLVTESGGGMIRRRMFRDRPSGDWTKDEPEPLAGIRAALSLEYAAREAAANSARYAREDGLSWAEIGEAFFPADPPPDAHSKAHAAFDRLSWAYDRWQAPSFTWTCPACLQLISDHGPETGMHPSEDEEGHAEGCARLAAAVAAWKAHWEDDE